MGIFNKLFSKSAAKPVTKSLRDIGYSGTVDELVSALQVQNNILFDQGGIPLVELSSGAADALKEGRPENLQAFFASGAGSGYILANLMHFITADQAEQALETTSADARKQILNEALITLSGRGESAEKIKALVYAGANQDANGGKPLREAFGKSLLGNVEALKAAGASFPYALHHARADLVRGKESGDTVAKLQLYTEAGCKVPSASPK